MCANLDQYTPPNKTKFETTKSAKNKIERPVCPLNCVYDHARPKVEHANNASTNKSALIILYHGIELSKPIYLY